MIKNMAFHPLLGFPIPKLLRFLRDCIVILCHLRMTAVI